MSAYDPEHPPQDPQELQDHEDRLTQAVESNEDTDVRALHQTILREKLEPVDGLEPVPLWLSMFFGIIIFWGGAYMAFYSGGFRADVYDETAVSWSGGGATAIQVDPIAAGKKLFTAYCSTCHQTTGMGVAGQYPPLVGSEFVLSKDGYGPNHLANIVLNGLQGPIKVKGQVFSGNMPAQKAQLKDQQIAYILTYIRQEWGNSAGPISAEGVAAVRKELASRSDPWTEAELKAMPAVELPGPAAPAATPAPAAGAPAPAEAKK
jgi:mono/diheme cytochrome c family protein